LLEELLEQEKLEQQLQQPQQPIQQAMSIQQPSGDGAIKQRPPQPAAHLPPGAAPVPLGYSRNPQGQYVRVQWQGQPRQIQLGAAGPPRMGHPVQTQAEQIQSSYLANIVKNIKQAHFIPILLAIVRTDQLHQIGASPIQQNTSAPVSPPPENPQSEDDKQKAVRYESWLEQEDENINSQLKHYETEIAKLRKQRKVIQFHPYIVKVARSVLRAS